MSPDRSPMTILVFQDRAGREPLTEWQDTCAILLRAVVSLSVASRDGTGTLR